MKEQQIVHCKKILEVQEKMKLVLAQVYDRHCASIQTGVQKGVIYGNYRV